uniref:NADH dehydrogenase [ubiquinone] 1 alpha subcomplex subunit 2 n=1 Tax=Romanomermis culicivorax TaxID=13658 RepID=A0A915J0C7_ROMCU
MAHKIALSYNNNAIKSFKIAKNLMEIRLNLAVYEPASMGALEFVEKFFPEIRKEHPQLNFRIVESPKTDPWLWGRFEHSRHKKWKLAFMTGNQVLAAVEQMTSGGRFQKKVTDKIPRGMTLLDTEQKHRNPFEVYSKYGSDD